MSALILLKKRTFQAIVLVVLTVVVYSNTFDVPFYLDDYSSIVNNPRVHDLTDLSSIWTFSPARFITSLSYAFSYTLSQDQVFHYHLFNLCVHLSVVALIWLLTAALLETPALANRDIFRGLPLLAALLFAVHPLHTQAVTYIVQRATSLAALFYLTALFCFVRARLERDSRRRIGWMATLFLAGLCALFTKQNTVTLPLALLVAELIFFRMSWRIKPRVALYTLLSLAGLFFVFNLVFRGTVIDLEQLDRATRESTEISRLDYLHTQIRVIWIYLGLFLFPHDLRLYYDLPLVQDFSFTVTVLGSLGHLLLLFLGFVLIRRSPLIAFALLFYYLTHLVESSIFPIRDWIFEHRTYLPNVGLCLLASTGALALAAKIGDRRSAAGFLIVLVVLPAWLCRQRNEEWRDPLAFTAENVELAPDHQIVWAMHGQYLLNNEKYREALAATQRCIQLGRKPDGTVRVQPQMISNLILIYRRLGQHEKADEAFEKYKDLLRNPVEKSRVLLEKANQMLREKKFDAAEELYKQILEIVPGHKGAMKNLAVTCANVGRLIEARELLNEVLEKYPGDQEAANNLKVIEATLKQHQR